MRTRHMTAHVDHDHQRRADGQRRHRRADQHAAADRKNEKERPCELSHIPIHVVSCRCRRETGTTRCSAVWVSEKRATFTSTSPAALAPFRTSLSVICAFPFGRITQIAPSRLSPSCTDKTPSK